MGRLRIIAGQFKGRKIEVPPGSDVRPTADRVREALFSILGASVVDARVLDAFSGSGALGFEALSRGAGALVLVESDPRVFSTLRNNACSLGVEDRCTFVQSQAQDFLRGPSRGPFDLILVDPPWGSGLAEIFLPLGARNLAEEGWIVVERDERTPCPTGEEAGLKCFRTAAYGRCRLDFFARPPAVRDE